MKKKDLRFYVAKSGGFETSAWHLVYLSVMYRAKFSHRYLKPPIGLRIILK